MRYIGRTVVSLSMRVSQHVHKARHKKDNTHKSNWIRELLKINSRPHIRLLCVVDGWEESYKKERELINKYRERLLNHNDRGAGNNAPKSKEQREKISKIFKSGYADGSIKHPRNTPLYIYDLYGNFIKCFPSMKIAGSELGIYYKSITKVLRGYDGMKQLHGYQFSTELKEMPDISKMRISPKAKLKSTLNVPSKAGML